MVSAITMNYVEEAVGIALAARASGMPVASPSRSKPMGDCRRGRT